MDLDGVFKLIKEFLTPYMFKQYYRKPRLVLTPFHQSDDYLFIKLEINYTYYQDIQDLSEALKKHGFEISSIDPVNKETFSIEIIPKEDESTE